MWQTGIRMEFKATFFLFCMIYSTSALYFHIRETEKKCFIEEIPDQTMVTGNYKVEMFDEQKNSFVPTLVGLGMLVEVKDPDNKELLSRIQEWNQEANEFFDQPAWSLGMHVVVSEPTGNVQLSRMYAAEGRFTFTSHTAGEHQICLHSNSTAWFGGGKLRVHLDIQVGDHAIDYQDVASKEKLTELQLRVRQLLDQVEQIQKEQNYQRYREERFRQTSESTNQRVLYWALAQTVVLLLTGFWQMRHLKGFFEAKKLV